jgi:hypothetical protein
MTGKCLQSKVYILHMQSFFLTSRHIVWKSNDASQGLTEAKDCPQRLKSYIRLVCIGDA